ncbi:AhpC/TSA antioxidant enzyme-domain-containing protein, partial [Cristinia sonorae]
FDENALVSREQLARAASMVVVAQNGLRIPFGDLFKDKKAIIIFIRHFWCAMDQDYMYSIVKNVDSVALQRAGTNLVIIGNGAHGMIKSYRHIFRVPFSLYTDPTLRLHAALGMTKRTNDPGPEFEKGEYVRHGLVGGIAMVVRNALKVGMPVWEKGGETNQLGGEFIFGPGMTCLYAHRMKYTRNHAPILGVLAAAGMQIYPTSRDDDDSQTTLGAEEDDQWAQDRERAARSKHGKRTRRRDGSGWNEEDVVAPEYDSETGSASVSGSWELSPRRAVSDPSERIERSESDHVPSRTRGSNTASAAARGRRSRQTARRFHVSNPDHGEDYYPYEGEKEELWRSGSSNALARGGGGGGGKYGRNDEAYMLTHDALAYSFGGSR